MNKKEQEELRRLEEALMETDVFDEELIDEIDLLEDTWQDIADLSPDIYNADDSDVDLDDYSQTVQTANRQPASGILVALILILSAVVVFCLLKILGVL